MRLVNAIAAFGCGYVIAITIIITIYSVQSYKRLRDKKLLAKSLMLTAIPLVLMLTAIGIYRFCK